MTIKDTLHAYYKSFETKTGWLDFFTEDVVFTSYTSPLRQLKGKAAFGSGIQRFVSSVRALRVRDMLVDGEKACCLVRYEIQPPQGPSFESDVAEIFTFKDGKFDTFGIYFDSTPYPKT